jgi:hypothetical protein
VRTWPWVPAFAGMTIKMNVTPTQVGVQGPGSAHWPWVPAFAGMTIKMNVTPTQVGVQGPSRAHSPWVPAFAGMTIKMNVTPTQVGVQGPSSAHSLWVPAFAGMTIKMNVTPTQVGVQGPSSAHSPWVPAFAGMTKEEALAFAKQPLQFKNKTVIIGPNRSCGETGRADAAANICRWFSTVYARAGGPGRYLAAPPHARAAAMRPARARIQPSAYRTYRTKRSKRTKRNRGVRVGGG